MNHHIKKIILLYAVQNIIISSEYAKPVTIDTKSYII